MSLDDLPAGARLQAKLYALQMITAALLVRHLENVGDSEAEAKELSDIAFGSIRKFKVRGEVTELQVDTARDLMEAFANETITAAADSVRKRRAQRSK